MSQLNMNQQNENGFALVMTMAILTGMLTIIVPLVLINNTRHQEGKIAEADALSRYGIDSARNLTQFINQRKGGADLSGFTRTASLPGWQDIPLPLHGSSQNTVSNFVPAFLMMATPLDYVHRNNRARGDESENFNEPFMNGVVIANNDWFIAGGELMTRNKRCLMGRLSSHRAMEIVFAVPSYSECWVKINGNWARIESVEYRNDLSAKLNLSGGLTFGQNDIVEFYPARVHNNHDRNVDLDIRVRVTDERSKFNICSITNNVSNLLGLNLGTNRNLPYVSPIAMVSDGSAANDIINTMQLITSYSSPDYTIINNGDIYKNRENYNGVVRVNGNRIYQHPINLNSSSLNVMGIAFEAMSINNPYKLAQDIVSYRNGKDGDNFNGGENPFDGYNPNKAGKYKFYSSPWEEFSDFLKTESSLNNADKYKVLQHLYAYGNLAHYKDLGSKSVPICFESDAVQTAHITSRVTSNKRPMVEEKAIVVSREIYHDMDNPTQGRIIIDSDNGWNQGMSTFYQLDWRQPQVESFDRNNETVTFNFDHHGGSNWAASPTLGSGLLGRLTIEHSVYLKYITKYQGNKFTAKVKNTNLLSDGVRRIDFGLRVITRPDHIKKVAPVTISGNQERFSVSNNNNFITGNNVKGRYFMYVPPGNEDPKLIDYYGTANNFKSTTMFEVEEGHKAYHVPNFGFENNNVIYPPVNDNDPVPYYETIVVREGADWDFIRWDVLRKGPTIKRVQINGQYFDPNDERNGGGNNIWTYFIRNLGNALKSKGVDKDYLRIRFEFDKNDDGDAFDDSVTRTGDYLGGCPQLFRIHVTYSLPDDMPRRVILDQR